MPYLEWKHIVIDFPVTFLSFGCLYLGILGIKSEQYICMLDSAYLIYGDPVVCLFSVFTSRKYIYFLILFSFCRPPLDRTKLALNLDCWKTIYFKIVALFLSFFWCTTFIFLSLRGNVLSGGENIFWFLLFELVSGVFFAFIFWCFLNVIR